MSERRVHVWVQAFRGKTNLMLQWLDPVTGRRRSKSAGTANADQAEKARADLEYELNHGKYHESSKLGWERFRELFDEEHLAGLRDRSREKYNDVLDLFEDLCRPRRIGSVDERMLSAFVRGLRERRVRGGKLGLEPITIRNYLVAVRKALNWAKAQKLIAELPNFPKIKVSKKKPQPIDPQQFEALLGRAENDHWKAYLLCGWYCGLRLSEAWHLHWLQADRWPWIDFSRDRIVLPATFVKADEDQWVPLHPRLRAALESLERHGPRVFDFRSKLTGEPLTRAAISNVVCHWAEELGFKMGMHRLRKGFGCRIAQQLGEGNAPILHELMRHKSMQITMDYYASVGDNLHAAIKRLV